MTRSILGADKNAFKKKLTAQKAICIAAAAVILAVNIILTLLRNNRNHTLLLWLNIALDILLGWFLIFDISLIIAPKQRLLKLCRGKRSSFDGEVVEITAETHRVRHFDCHTVLIKKEDSERQFFLPADTVLSLNAGDTVRISAVSNIIVEAE